MQFFVGSAINPTLQWAKYLYRTMQLARLYYFVWVPIRISKLETRNPNPEPGTRKPEPRTLEPSAVRVASVLPPAWLSVRKCFSLGFRVKALEFLSFGDV
jgi:hypothetical protein